MFTPQERLSYEESLKDYRDIYSVMKTQFDKGKVEGVMQVALNLKSMGLSVSQIIQATGLSQEEIEKL